MIYRSKMVVFHGFPSPSKGSLKLPEGKWKQVTMTALFSLPNNSQWTKFAVGSTHVRIHHRTTGDLTDHPTI